MILRSTGSGGFPTKLYRGTFTNAISIVGFAALVVITAVLSGCGNGSSSASRGETVAEIKAGIAHALVAGKEYQAMRVEAERFDPVTQELHNIRVTGPRGLLHAERASIEIDLDSRMMTLRLVDVVIADAQSKGDEAGVVMMFKELVLDPVSIDGGKWW